VLPSEIQVGETYETRAGRIVTVIGLKPDLRYGDALYAVETSEDTPFGYRTLVWGTGESRGKISVHTESDRDLVALISGIQGSVQFDLFD
jgi:hypothetical protein